ncbi:hypothetical protein CN425_12910 [Bacillus cereus]|uniref:Uncharacterized protein n=1 Tax=Bacillus cereus TaxID=1396 RepID=A0A2A8PVG1_BACCE|nr:hypothetical protein CON38_06225 [Bacillus cereus]PEW01510.1 hypothetical protein CN425_12910 [Bacillus cereus]PEX94390.1 hypothetical protein CN450_00275 [Bacillus cereus]PFI25454.1 hypothetical protein COI75_05670 [Bacillus cereus]PFN27273.1 hypothetical protein COJ50_10060 [Bacillus cereus]
MSKQFLKEDKKNYPLLKKVLTLCMVIHIINIVDRATSANEENKITYAGVV